MSTRQGWSLVVLTIVVLPSFKTIWSDPSTLLVSVATDIIDVAEYLLPLYSSDNIAASLCKWDGERNGCLRRQVVCLVGPLNGTG